MNIRDEFIKFFVSKDHKEIPSSPVVPENDPSVLFNTAGMQPLVPYLLGEKHPLGKRLCDSQKCIRTNDLDEVGDETHHTFFEMLGNWSLGDYFKEDSISYSYEFLTDVLKIDKDRLAVTVFSGNDYIKKDEESYELWLKKGISKDKIAFLDDNFWIAGETGPCGSDTEIFYYKKENIPEKFDPEDENWVEIWNNVFMEYFKENDNTIRPLKQKNVDTGMGYERICAVIEKKDDNYLSSIWKNLLTELESITGKKYEDNKKAFRIIMDHIRTIVFISADEAKIKPSNVDQGYILRRLIRRMIRYARILDIDINSDFDIRLANVVINDYKDRYTEVLKNKEVVFEVLKNEKNKFSKTIEKGLREFDKVSNKDIDGETAFHLFDTYGFPLELTIELAKEKNLKVDEKGYHEKFKEHQEKSRAGSTQKFKGGLQSTGEMETKYHTATHLLNAALKVVVSKDCHQMGSNITSERMRFDFSCDHKLTDEEKKQTEDLVNKWINEGLDVTCVKMSKEDAIKSGAECRFIEKYPDEVTVYNIGDVSSELCGGPHVKNTKELGKFIIKKEESSSSGVRRIKGILEVGE